MNTAEETRASGPAVRKGVADALKDRLIGIDLVDLLFALVVFELLEPLREPGEIVLVGWWHLAVGLTLTLLSWMGYHASVGAVDERSIKAPEPPFWHLLLDIAMVVAYWLTAVTYERNPKFTEDVEAWWSVHDASAVPEASFVFATFVLYVLWDYLARYIHVDWNGGKDRWWDDEGKEKNKWRRIPTWVAVVVAPVLLLLSIATSEREKWVVAVDVALIGVLFAFRFGKEYVESRYFRDRFPPSDPKIDETYSRRRRSQGLGLVVSLTVAVLWLAATWVRDLT